MQISKIFIAIILISCTTRLQAQETWPSPEMQQMYTHATEYMYRGNYKDAIVTYKQLMALAPGRTSLATDLANAYLLAAEYVAAEQTITPVLPLPDATGAAFGICARSQFQLYHDKEARSTIKKGLARFPASGGLYYINGLIAEREKDSAAALAEWLKGTEAEPAYADNYKDAALAYLHSDYQLWGLLLGETYLYMQHDTTGDADIKTALYAGWKTFFDQLPDNKTRHLTPFEQAVTNIYLQLTPVISDGISTENLTMVRTRFLLEWNGKYKAQYPFALFTYQDSLIRNGWFDICDEQLYGEAESKAQYAAWNKFHAGIMDKFMQWQRTNALQPVPAASYYDKSSHMMDLIFAKKKKR